MTNNIDYSKRIIAFVDILGFKEIIRESDKDTSKITTIYEVLDYLKKLGDSNNWTTDLLSVEESAQYKGMDKFNVKDNINSTSFSDSIVVSIELDDNINEMASTLIVNLAYIGTILIKKGILIRGGITTGNLVHNEDGIVFGQGLIDAYMLESKAAKFPRIILSNKLIGQLNYPLLSKRERYPYHLYVERFQDGCVGFHQMIFYQVMQSSSFLNKELTIKDLDIIRKIIVKGLDSSFEAPEVHEKYIWLREQYKRLVILSDTDFETQTDENVKFKIRDVNEGIAGQNIHYKYTDDFYESRRNSK